MKKNKRQYGKGAPHSKMQSSFFFPKWQNFLFPDSISPAFDGHALGKNFLKNLGGLAPPRLPSVLKCLELSKIFSTF